MSDSNDELIRLNLESHNKTSYLFNQVNTMIYSDLDAYGFMINGTYKYPVYNIIPKKVFFNLNDTLTVSQISFIQDHNKYFYDTNVAMSSYLRKNINLLTLVESKSIQKENYTKKVLISLNKSNKYSNIETGYMYHYESIPTYNPEDLMYNRSLESFSGKLSYHYIGSNLKIANRVNFETANNNRYNDKEVTFQSNTNWNNFDVEYSINENLMLNFKSTYKYVTSNNQSGNFNKLQLSTKYLLGKHFISVGATQFKSKESIHVDYKVGLGAYGFFFKADKNAFLNVASDSLNINTTYNNDKRLGFFYENEFIDLEFVIGNNSSNIIDESYEYYLIKSKLVYHMFGANLKYMKNNSDELFINYSTNLNATFSPVFKDKRYRIYFGAGITKLGLNPWFSFNQNNFDLMHSFNGEFSVPSVSTIDGEFGIMFKYFKIAFIKENIYKDAYQYSSNITVSNSSNYLVNIVWIFKD